MTGKRFDALLVFLSPLTTAFRPIIVEFATKHRLPTMFELRADVEAGGLMAYSPSLTDTFRRAADYVDRILKGARPGELAIEQPTRFELIVNLKTAKALGMTLPSSVLLRADTVIDQ
jgi:putative ABC transport system substrate-binding protein